MEKRFLIGIFNFSVFEEHTGINPKIFQLLAQIDFTPNCLKYRHYVPLYRSHNDKHLT